MLLECKGYTPEKFEDVIICESEQKGKILKLTKAKFVNGPSTSMDTSPGYLETISTKNSDAFFSIFLDFGGGKEMFPNPSEP